MFDLIIDPLFIEAGQERGQFPGLFACSAPRKASRLRGQDQVAFFFSQSGTALLAPNLQQEMLSRLADTYYQSNGSVTSGMRVTVERLNDFLLNRNLRDARQGGQVIGGLGMGVIHGGTLYLLLAGNVQAFVFGGTRLESFSDPAARGLGQARVVGSRFFTSAFDVGCSLLLTTDPPAEWTETHLREWANLPVEELHRRLAGETLDLQAVLIRCMSGRGEITWTRQARQQVEPKVSREEVKPPAARPARPSGVFLSGKPLTREPAVAVERQADREVSPVSIKPQPAAAEAVAPRQASAPPPESRGSTSSPAASHGPSASTVAAARAASGAISWLRKGFGAIGAGLSKLAARVIPGQPVEGLSISPSTMLFVALAVPVAVVAVAATVYFQRGRGEQYQAYLGTAAQFAQQAAAQEDITLQREDWNQVLAWMDKADEYGRSEEGNQLRRQAQAALDEMDGIQRLVYLPAGKSLPEGVTIVRMVATLNDVYLLDSQVGQVFRLYRTGDGYELDAQFTCGPGKAGAVVIGPLIDIAAMPPTNDYKATVMGIDGGGNLVFCAPGSSGFSSTQLTVPDAGWGQITGMVLFQNVLYVLDPTMNGVYRFFAEKGMVFAGPPRLYFDSQIPHLTDVIDLAADQQYLYLLHADGSMTTCTDAGFTTECSDPAPYGDSRAGRPADPLTFEDATFLRLQTTQPPDPSLYVLDDQAASIYHLSLRRLNLQRQYRPELDPDYPLPDRKATAFVITPNRRAMLAFGNLVFSAPLP